MKKIDVIENLLVAQAMVLDLPDEAINLNLFANAKLITAKRHTCDSVGCFGGWVAVHPYFKALGVRPYMDGSPETKYLDFPSQVSNYLFGDKEMFRMKQDYCVTEKQEILNRIDRALTAALAGAQS